MQSEIFFSSVAILGGILATATDFHRHWVPDFVNYGMVLIGLFGHGILSIITKSYTPILYSAIGFGAFFGLANLMFYTGMWGGGDSKLLMGFGALLPLLPKVAPWPSLVSLFTNIIFIGVVYGIAYTLILGIKKRDKFFPELLKISRTYLPLTLIVLAIGIIPVVMYLKSSNILFLILWLIALLLIFLVFTSKAVESTCMFKDIAPSQMEVGERVVEKVRIDNKLIYSPKKVGLEEADLKRLKELEADGKLNKLKIKEGIPYAPAFLFGALFTVFVGDLFMILVPL